MQQIRLLLFFVLMGFSAMAQNFQWAHLGGQAARGSQGSDMVRDIAGNSYYVCFGADTLQLGSFKVQNDSLSAGTSFVLKYNPSGILLWAKVLGTHDLNQETQLRGIGLDASGHLYVAGGCSTDCYYDNRILIKATKSASFLMKLDTSGSFQWAKYYGDGLVRRKVLIDNKNNIILAGETSVHSYPVGAKDNFVTKLDSSGKRLWWKALTCTANQFLLEDYSLDGFGNIYTCGNFYDTLHYGSSMLARTGTADMFILKISPVNGNAIWLRGSNTALGNTSQTNARGIACFPGGYFYLTGSFGYNITIDGKTLGGPQVKGLPTFIGLFDDAGSLKWLRSAGADTGFTQPSCLTLYKRYAYFGGQYAGCAPSFGHTALPYINGQPMFISKIDSVGNFLWSFGTGAAGSLSFCSAMATDTAGSAFATGYTFGDPTFGKISLKHVGYSDAFFAKISDVSLWRDNILSTRYCAGDSISIPYHVKGIIQPGNRFRAELSDSSGSFDTTLYLLGYVDKTGNGIIKGRLPYNIAYSKKYNVQVASNDPDVTSYYNPQTIEIYPLPDIHIKYDSLRCYGQRDTFSARGGLSYLWSPGDQLSNTHIARPVFSADSSASYRLLAYNALGCPDSAFIRIKVSPPLTLSVNRDTLICPGKAVGLKAIAQGGVSASYLFSWDQGLGTGGMKTVNPVKTARYKVILSDGCSNTVTDSVQVQVYLPLKVSAGKDQGICPGRSNILSAIGTGGRASSYIYTWDQGLGTGAVQTVQPPTTTRYRVILDDQCSLKPDTAYVNIYRLPPMHVISPRDTTVCYGTSYRFQASGRGGDSLRYIYQWDNGLGMGAAKTVRAEKSTTFRVILSDSCSLHSDTGYFVLTVLPALSLKKISDTIICNGQAINLQASGSGGAGDTTKYRYQWLPASYGNGRRHPVRPLADTRYSVILSDACSENDTADVLVKVRRPLSVDAGRDRSLCYHQNLSLMAEAKGGDSAHYRYIWHPLEEKGAVLNVKALVSSAVYIVSVSDGCSADSAMDELQLSVSSPITVSTLKDSAVCAGKDFHISATASGGRGAYAYRWDAAHLTDNIVSHASRDTTLRLIVSDGCSPDDSAYIRMRIVALPIIRFDIDPASGCGPLRVVFRNISGNAPDFRYSFSFGDSSSAERRNLDTLSHIYTRTGVYYPSIQMNNDLGCKTIGPVGKVSVDPPIHGIMEISPPIRIIGEGAITFVNQGRDIDSSLWSFGDSSMAMGVKVSHSYRDTGIYAIRLVSRGRGCFDTSLGSVLIVPPMRIYFPDAFTPNQDGLNDQFLPQGLGWASLRFRIYDRWGSLIYQSDATHLKGWDGTFGSSGLPAPMDVYIWYVYVSDYNGNERFYQGNVTLLR